MAPAINEFPHLTVLFFLWFGFVFTASVFGLAYLAYRKMRRHRRPRGARR